MTALRFRRLVRECLSTRPGAIPLGLAFPEQYVVGVDVVTPVLCHPIVPSAVLNPSLSLPPSPPPYQPVPRSRAEMAGC
jgi:hypothetical protein